jgi:hypothetical protein
MDDIFLAPRQSLRLCTRAQTRPQVREHLAAALELGDELDGIVTYDDRLAQAAALKGIAVVAP